MMVIESLAPRSAEMRSASSSSQSISALLVILLINFLKNPAMGLCGMVYAPVRKLITSPSLTTYSFPSARRTPASRAAPTVLCLT